jgi:hypothetical protein
MNRIFDFLDKHKFGVIVSISVYIGLFVYFQVYTYKKMYAIPVWDEKTNIETPEEIEIKPENIESNPQNQNPSDLKSISQNANEQKEKSYENWSTNKISKSVEKDVADLEKKYFNETGGAQKREKIIQETQTKKNDLKNQNKEKQTTQTTGTEKSYAGSVMVEWVLANREPHQNNSWNIRNPGYTCGSGSSGKVSIKIKVDASGNVISATYVPELSFTANSCMIEQAKKYALMSRFSFINSGSKTQEGSISYTFVSQ